MKNNLIGILFFIGLGNFVVSAEAPKAEPKEEDLVVCQDQADNHGNGKGDDYISTKCIDYFKDMASKNFTMKESKLLKMKVFGFRNMLLIEKVKGDKIATEITAGNSTELSTIKALAIDEKNQEIVVLEEDGDVLFFSSKITGNVAPYRILKNKELEGATELAVDSSRDLVVLNNKKNKKILFFSRLANINGRKENQKLDIVKSINTDRMDLKDLSVDPIKQELRAFDESKNQGVGFDLNNLFARPK